MSQSSYIVALLLAGFVLFIAARDRLTVYEAILWGGSSSGSSGGSPARSPEGSNSASPLGVGDLLADPFGTLTKELDQNLFWSPVLGIPLK